MINDNLQTRALNWLSDHGGTGQFIASGNMVVALNTVAPYERPVWEALRDAGKVEFRAGKVTVCA